MLREIGPPRRLVGAALLAHKLPLVLQVHLLRVGQQVALVRAREAAKLAGKRQPEISTVSM